MIKVIETKYGIYKFRSRLEARWAVLFDALNIEYLYEHEGYELPSLGLYLPDFWLPKLVCFAEIKSQKFTKLEYDKCDLLEHPCILLDAPIPKLDRFYYITHQPQSNYDEYLCDDSYGYEMYGCDLAHSAFKHRIYYSFGEPKPSLDNYTREIQNKATMAQFEYGKAHRIFR